MRERMSMRERERMSMREREKVWPLDRLSESRDPCRSRPLRAEGLVCTALITLMNVVVWSTAVGNLWPC